MTYKLNFIDTDGVDLSERAASIAAFFEKEEIRAMIYTDLSSLENHLWQSSLCAAGVWLLTLVLKKTGVLRYWLWLAASAKF